MSLEWQFQLKISAHGESLLMLADESRVPGGSSGGSAVAVASKFMYSFTGKTPVALLDKPCRFHRKSLEWSQPISRVPDGGLSLTASSFDAIGGIST